MTIIKESALDLQFILFILWMYMWSREARERGGI